MPRPDYDDESARPYRVLDDQGEVVALASDWTDALAAMPAGGAIEHRHTGAAWPPEGWAPCATCGGEGGRDYVPPGLGGPNSPHVEGRRCGDCNGGGLVRLGECA